MTTKVRTTGLVAACVALLTTIGACSAHDTQPKAAVPTKTTHESLSAFKTPNAIERDIPIRFVQYVDSTDPTKSAALTTDQLDEQIEGLNATFWKAGLAFYRDDDIVVESPTFVDLGANYTWPSPTSSAQPLVFDPGCSLTLPPSGTEAEDMALFRAGSYCARDGEIIVFTVNSTGSGESHGTYPWEANAVIMQRWSMTTPQNRTFAHEVGHYLGLPHAFHGGGGSYDLGSSNCLNPATGAPSQLSDFWDLVYKPADASPATSGNVYFSSYQDAASKGYPESSLRPIQGNSGPAPIGYVCQQGNCGTWPDGTLRMAVPRTQADYTACLNDPSTCICATNPNQCDVLYTTQTGMSGLGFNLQDGYAYQYPAETGSGVSVSFGANVMSYNYSPGLQDDAWSVSQSQIEQLDRVLSYDIQSNWFPGTYGRRPNLGNGTGYWSDWEFLGGPIDGKPSVTGNPSTGQLDAIVESGGTAYYLPSGSWSWTSLGGGLSQQIPLASARRGSYLGVYGIATNGAVEEKVQNPNLSWWPGGWYSLGGVATGVTAVSWDSTRIDLTVRSTGGGVYWNYWDSSTSAWSGYLYLGVPPNVTVSDTPTMFSWGTGHLDLIAMDTNGQIWNKVYNSGYDWWPSRTGWSNISSMTFQATPAISSWGVNHLDVVGWGSDGQAHNKVWQPSAWWPSQTGWANIGGSLAGPPSIVSWSGSHGEHRLDVVARGSDNSLLYKYWDGSTGQWWPAQTDWAKIATDIQGDPVIVENTGTLYFFVRGSDGDLWYRYYLPA